MSPKPNPNWPTSLRLTLADEACVLVTLNLILGSSPRESGSRMMVTAESMNGSIGGGNLEYTAIQKARELLAESGRARQLHQPFGLGPALNQCCGGAVRVHFEVLPQGCPDWLEELCAMQLANVPVVFMTAVDCEKPHHELLSVQDKNPIDIPDTVIDAASDLLRPDQKGISSSEAEPQVVVETESGDWWLDLIQDERQALLLFGAGHVGQEVARLLRPLPFRLTWVDERADIFPAEAAEFCTLISSDPVTAVAESDPNSVFVVMTHSHELDEDICHAVLSRVDFRWLGLIGSGTKRRRFVHRLQQRGIDEELLQRLVCPIGLAGIDGKQPATIALSLVAQLMMAHKADSAKNKDSKWTVENN